MMNQMKKKEAGDLKRVKVQQETSLQWEEDPDHLLEDEESVHLEQEYPEDVAGIISVSVLRY